MRVPHPANVVVRVPLAFPKVEVVTQAPETVSELRTPAKLALPRMGDPAAAGTEKEGSRPTSAPSPLNLMPSDHVKRPCGNRSMN